MFLSAVLCYNWTDDKVGSGISIVYIILEKGLPITYRNSQSLPMLRIAVNDILLC